MAEPKEDLISNTAYPALNTSPIPYTEKLLNKIQCRTIKVNLINKLSSILYLIDNQLKNKLFHSLKMNMP